ncbi:MAG: GAP family protein [Thermoleophilaceae bacterium]
MGSLVQLMPLAFVMVAGPQILSPIFLATSAGWRRNSMAYVAGAALSIAIVVVATYFIVKGLKSTSSASKKTKSDVIDYVILGLLAFLIVRTYLTRKTAKKPKWMERLQRATPRFAFELGFVLLGFFPTDIASSVAVGSRLAGHNEPLWHGVGFYVLTLFLISIPALMVLLLGKRAEVALPKVRDWMDTNSWVVSELVLLLFVGIEINSIAG